MELMFKIFLTEQICMPEGSSEVSDTEVGGVIRPMPSAIPTAHPKNSERIIIDQYRAHWLFFMFIVTIGQYLLFFFTFILYFYFVICPFKMHLSCKVKKKKSFSNLVRSVNRNNFRDGPAEIYPGPELGWICIYVLYSFQSWSVRTSLLVYCL